MNKPVRYLSLADLILDFAKGWIGCSHALQTVTLSRPIPHHNVHTTVCWDYMCLDVSRWENAARFIAQYQQTLELSASNPAGHLAVWDRLAEQLQADPFQRQKRWEREREKAGRAVESPEGRVALLAPTVSLDEGEEARATAGSPKGAPSAAVGPLPPIDPSPPGSPVHSPLAPPVHPFEGAPAPPPAPAAGLSAIASPAPSLGLAGLVHRVVLRGRQQLRPAGLPHRS
eukprot:GGOE01002197.1.p3 GENE.GGOE01002197.1~~GGOE01002197.1.p3  ORF type:complete len:229 (+),score=54.96 GGOE01002197.1:588-1274(+)